MPLLDATRNYLHGTTSAVEANLRDLVEPPEPQWRPPEFRGRPIWEHLPEIARLKRGGELRAALALAEGSLDAMRQAAQRDPSNVYELYVVEVVALQQALRRDQDAVATITDWLALGFDPPHPDMRADLEKRLAKAEENLARQVGADPAPARARWREKVAQARAIPATPRAELTGRARQPRVKKAATSIWIPPKAELLKDSYVAVDFETANRISGASACQVAMVKVSGGEVVDSFCTYLRPPEEYILFEFSHIHGIYRGDVEDAPSWFDIADDVVEFVGDAPVYAHNATFDASVWRGLDRYYFTGTYPKAFYCTCRMSRRLLPGLADHTLPTVTEYCAPGFALNHHRADSDALACAHIVAMLRRTRTLHHLLPA